jgi:hypothetical protein
MFRPKRVQRDFQAEIEAHIKLEEDRLRGAGLSEAEARDAARRSFGNRTRVEERFYESGRWLWWDHFHQDLRYALRALRHAPMFTVAAVLTLGLGIGANTAIFSVIHAALLKPLPYHAPDRIVMLYLRSNAGDKWVPSAPDFLDIQRQSRCLEAVAAYRANSLDIAGRDRPERVEGVVVTPGFFPVLGLPAQLRRTVAPGQDRPGGAPAR